MGNFIGLRVSYLKKIAAGFGVEGLGFLVHATQSVKKRCSCLPDVGLASRRAGRSRPAQCREPLESVQYHFLSFVIKSP